jgi:hypothetical protein
MQYSSDIIYSEVCTVIARQEAICVTIFEVPAVRSTDCSVPRNDAAGIFIKAEFYSSYQRILKSNWYYNVSRIF